MKKQLFAIGWTVVSLLVSVSVANAQSNKNADKVAIEEVKAAVSAMTKALKTKGKALFERYVSPDYIHTNPAGEVTSRQKEYADMTSGVQTFSIEPIEVGHDSIRVYNGNTAIIPVHYKVSGSDHGNEIRMQTRALSTWVKQNGNWQLVAFQATGVAKPFQK